MSSTDGLADLKAGLLDASEALLMNVLIRGDRFQELVNEYKIHARAYSNALMESLGGVNSEVGEAHEQEADYYELSSLYLLNTLAEIRRRRGMD